MVHMNSTSSMYFIHLTANLSLDHLLSGKYPIGLHDVVLASFFFCQVYLFFFHSSPRRKDMVTLTREKFIIPFEHLRDRWWW